MPFDPESARKKKPYMLSDLADAINGLAEGSSAHKTATSCSKQRDAADATNALVSSSRIKQPTRSSAVHRRQLALHLVRSVVVRRPC